jgi:hypothetical protein
MAAENMALFSVNFFWQLGTAENSLFSAANALFSAVPSRRKCL